MVATLHRHVYFYGLFSLFVYILNMFDELP